MSKPSIEQTKMGAEGIAFCIARTLIERDPSLKAPLRANLRKMWELLEEREDHGAADMVDTMTSMVDGRPVLKPKGSIAFSSEVSPGSRKENASKQKHRAPAPRPALQSGVALPSEPRIDLLPQQRE